MDNNLLDIIKNEGDHKEWVYLAMNGLELKCEIFRQTELGHLCGYVTITDESEFYNMEFLTPPGCKAINYHSLKENGEYVVGFDCGGYGDIVPYLSKFMISTSNLKTYKDMGYVKEQCEILAEFISLFPSIKNIRRNTISEILK